VLPGGPAFHAGLRKGDRILKVGAHTRIAIVRSSAVTSV
jgi:C-terminal processing protease CtpA/Prc